MLPTASQLPLRFACPGSAALPTTASRASEPAEQGTVVHLYLERIGAGVLPEDALDLVESDDHRALCAAIDLDKLPRGTTPEVALAYDISTGRARELGRRLGRMYLGLRPTEMAGTADAVGLSDDAVFVGDYKTGHHVVPAATNVQLVSLCLFAARAYQRDRAVGEIVRIKSDGAVWRDRVELDGLDLDAYAADLHRLMDEVVRLQTWPTAPNVIEGDHCRFCPSWDFCPAKAATLVRVASGAELDPLASLLPLTPELAGHAWTKLRTARRVLERLEAACHAALTEYGELPLPSGGVLRRVTEPGNERLDGRIVFAVVRELLDQEVAEQAVEIETSKAAIERALRAAAEKGKLPPRGRAAAMRRVLDELRARGGASKPMVHRVVEVQSGEERR